MPNGKCSRKFRKISESNFLPRGNRHFPNCGNRFIRKFGRNIGNAGAIFYATQREGGDLAALATLKAELIAEQQKALENRRDEACKELRTTRDGLYRDLLDHQRETRHGLHERQDAGLENTGFFELVKDGRPGMDLTATFRDASEATLTPRDSHLAWANDDAFEGSAKEDNAGIKSGANIAAGLVEGVGFALLSFLDGASGGNTGSKPAPKPLHREADAPETNPLDAVIADARKRQQHELDQADEEWRKRQRSYGE